MSARFSTGLRQFIQVTGPIRQALANSELRIYSGPIPASVDSAISASNLLLCTIRTSTGGGLNLADSAPGGLLLKDANEVWQGDVAASGTATFYRHVLPSDTGAASETAVRIQGTAGVAGQNMSLSNPQLVLGAVQRLESYIISLPEA